MHDNILHIKTLKMKLTYYISISYILVYISFSCNENLKYENKINISHQDFGNPITLKSEVIDFNEPVMMPGLLILHDSFLLIQNLKAEKLISIYNLNSRKKVNECLSFGMGPDELLRIKNMQLIDSLLYISDNQKGVISKYNIKEILNSDNPVPQSTVKIKEMFSSSLCLLDGYVTIAMNPNLKRLCFFDNNGIYTKTEGDFPVYNAKPSPIEGVESFISEMAIDTKKKNIYLFCMQTDLIEIYNFDGVLLKRMHGPDGFFPQIREVKMGEEYSKIASSKESRDAYFTPIIVGDEVYVSYSGAFRIPGQTPPIRNILVFDDMGNPIRRYELSESIIRFTVDSKTKDIYAVSENPEYHLFKFKCK